MQGRKEMLKKAREVMVLAFLFGLSVMIVGVLFALLRCPKEVMHDFQTKHWTFWIPLYSIPFGLAIVGGISAIIIGGFNKKVL
jgi:hypothetical protein